MTQIKAKNRSFSAQDIELYLNASSIRSKSSSNPRDLVEISRKANQKQKIPNIASITCLERGPEEASSSLTRSPVAM